MKVIAKGVEYNVVTVVSQKKFDCLGCCFEGHFGECIADEENVVFHGGAGRLVCGRQDITYKIKETDDEE